MTNSEAIKELKEMIKYEWGTYQTETAKKHVEALNMAIKALEKEPILDKIRAEIESQRKEVSKKHSENGELQAFYNGLNDGLKDARDIIDEYKAESEE